MIIFHMVNVINGADLGSGFRSRMLGVGGSVAKARAAKVSMMRFTHSSWTAVNTEVSVLLATADMKVKTTAVMLTVTWNYRWLANVLENLRRVTNLEELLDGVVDSSAPHDCFDNRGKVVVH